MASLQVNHKAEKADRIDKKCLCLMMLFKDMKPVVEDKTPCY